MRALLVLALLIPITAKADDNTALHMAAHIGASYALTLTAYGILKQTRLITSIQEDPSDKVPNLMAAGFTSLMVGFLYKHLQKDVNPADFNRSMIYNAVGVTGGIGSVLTFDF